jgi:hypothetical protein
MKSQLFKKRRNKTNDGQWIEHVLLEIDIICCCAGTNGSFQGEIEIIYKCCQEKT